MPKRETPVPSVAQLIELAILHGDWIRAAMAAIQIGEKAVRFNDRFYIYTVDGAGSLLRLDPTIKKGALDFGLHEGQVDRFYGRVCKVLCRELRQRRQQARG